MSRITFLFLLQIALSSVSNADLTCLTHFAATAPDEADPAPLVSRYYLELFNELGGTQLTPDTLTKIVAAKDPFTIPEQTGADTFSLQKRLREFEGLVKAKGWDTPLVRERLMADLNARAGNVMVVKEQQENSVLKNRNDFALPKHVDSRTVSSPDGRYLVYTLKTVGETAQLGIFDTNTQTEKKLKIPFKYDYSPSLSPDGKELLFPMREEYFRALPFENGTILTDKPRDVGQPSGVAIPGHPYVQTGKSHDFVYSATSHRSDSIQRLHLQTGERTDYDIEKYFGNTTAGKKRGTLVHWSVVPGTDRVALHWKDGNDGKLKLDIVEVPPKGELKRIDQRVSPTSVYEQLAWSHDGTVAFMWEDGRSMPVMYYPAKRGANPKSLPFTLDAIASGANIKEVVASPTEPYVLVRREQDAEHWAEVVDTKTFKVKARLELPPLTYGISFTADGTGLLVDANVDGNGQNHYINVGGRFDVGK